MVTVAPDQLRTSVSVARSTINNSNNNKLIPWAPPIWFVLARPDLVSFSHYIISFVNLE